MVWPDFVPRTSVKKILAMGQSLSAESLTLNRTSRITSGVLGFSGDALDPRGDDLLGGCYSKFCATSYLDLDRIC